jgi:hypothetical protein
MVAERELLRPIADGVWLVEAPLRFMGIPAGRRMTVVRLAEGDLWIHSPAPLTSGLRSALESAGQPRFVIAPTAVHGHRFMEQYRDAYPSVELHAAPTLDRRRKDLSFDAILGSSPDPRWAEVLDQTVFQGHLVPEVVFFHGSSRTLILADLLMNPMVRPEMAPGARLVWWLEDLHGEPGMSRTMRVGTRNRRGARRSVDRILEWDFDRIVLGHGANVETGGRAVFERSMAWI